MSDQMRRFELTISVWVPEYVELPKTFGDWIERAFGIDQSNLPATPTQLERVVETRHPPAEDIVERRAHHRIMGATKSLYQ